MNSDKTIKAVLIDGQSKIVQELDIVPSHLAIEEEIGTRFWIGTPLLHRNGDKLYFHDSAFETEEPAFTFMDVPYIRSGLIVGVDRYGDLRDANTPVEQVRSLVRFP